MNGTTSVSCVGGDYAVDYMGLIGDAQFGQFPNDVLNPGAVAEIRRTVIKRVGRSTVFQNFQAKNKDTIVVWRLDLNRILHVLNVRSAVFTLLSPTVSLQTELTMNIHVIDFDTHHISKSWKIRYNLAAPVIEPPPRQGLITYYIPLSVP